jgi:hypothetical protein
MLKYLALTAVLCVSAAAQTSHPCTQFSVVTQDKLKNFNQGLSPDDQKWIREKVEKKSPSVCYVDPSAAAPLVFFITVTPDTYHGTRVVTNTQSQPISGTITDEDGNTSRVSGETSTTSSTAVPYSFEYGIYTLAVELQQKDGSFVVLHRFQQKGIYNTLYGIPLGGKGHHPAHAVIEEAANWIGKGGLTEQERLAAQPSAPVAIQSEVGPSPKVVSNSESSIHPDQVATTPEGSGAVLDISSKPTGGEIEMDGAFVGNTPASVEVSPGEHSIKITKKGFAPWERRLKAMPGHATVNPELEATDATVSAVHKYTAEQSVDTESKCTPAIETTLAGEFNGWEGETIFKLSNGQIWEQAEYDYMYSYSYMPEVTIYPTTTGCKLKVEDENETVLVKRIK